MLWIEPEEFSHHSLLLSKTYFFAMAIGLAEFTVSWMFLEQAKTVISAFAYPCGLLMILVGETFRKSAWLTARRSFSHLIRRERHRDHMLVTHGVYSWSRHPGYFGWAVWALGTQVLLANPVCFVVFAIVIWRFFKMRITYEETFLRKMFGKQYELYAQHVPTRIPGIT